MCTSGWIKTENGAILFKNRDRGPEESITSSFLREQGDLVLFSDKHFGGCWFGWNGYFAISDTLGPHQKVCSGRTEEREAFRLMEEVLQTARSVEDAAKLYERLFFERKIGMSYNILIADPERVVVLELIHDSVRERLSETSVVCVNMFENMSEFNEQGDSESIACSEGRSEKCSVEMPNIHCAEDVLDLLASHSDDERKNVCRHGEKSPDSVTVASVVLEFKGDEVLLYYCLNKNPCEGRYTKKQAK